MKQYEVEPRPPSRRPGVRAAAIIVIVIVFVITLGLLAGVLTMFGYSLRPVVTGAAAALAGIIAGEVACWIIPSRVRSM
jgi:membrane associated rhomboid family serine protease